MLILQLCAVAFLFYVMAILGHVVTPKFMLSFRLPYMVGNVFLFSAAARVVMSMLKA